MLSGFEMVYNVGPGYYSITELCRAIADSIQIDDVNQAYLNSDVATAVDLSGAPDYTSILKLEGVVEAGIRHHEWHECDPSVQ